MAANGGRHRFGPDGGRLTLRTYRTGLAAQAGHDLTIEVTRWWADLDGPDGAPTRLEARIELGSLRIREGTGGVKPLNDRDRDQIASTARKHLQTDRCPDAGISATQFEPDGRGGGMVAGALTLHGQTRPLRLHVSRTPDGRYRASASVVQSQFGIKPYSGMFGTLKLRDAIDVEIDVPGEPGGRS